MKTENLTYNINHQKHYLSVNNKYRNANKTAAGVNPSGRLSFKAAPAQVVARTFGEKLAVNKGFNKFLDILSDNTLIAEALIALGLTAFLRPAAIYAIPAKDENTKKKNNYQVGQSIATGLLGLATTFAVAEPINRGVKKVLKNPEKYMKTDSSYIKKNERVFREIAKRVHQPIFLPLRAALTIMIIKPILNAMGLYKPSKNAPVVQADKKVDYSFMNFKKAEEKNTFNKFVNFKGAQDKSNNNISFKGKENIITSGIAKGIGKLADTAPFRKFINWIPGKDGNRNWFPHVIAAESVWLSGFYMQQTAASKKIEKDQKPAMILNQGITLGLCTFGAYKFDGLVNKKLQEYKEVYKRMNPDMVRKSNFYEGLMKRYANSPETLAKLAGNEKFKVLENANKTLNNKMIGIRLLGPIVIFTTIYRFVGPVLVTPVANKISEWIKPQKKAA